jgi:hypothetical protein
MRRALLHLSLPDASPLHPLFSTHQIRLPFLTSSFIGDILQGLPWMRVRASCISSAWFT